MLSEKCQDPADGKTITRWRVLPDAAGVRRALRLLASREELSFRQRKDLEAAEVLADELDRVPENERMEAERIMNAVSENRLRALFASAGFEPGEGTFWSIANALFAPEALTVKIDRPSDEDDRGAQTPKAQTPWLQPARKKSFEETRGRVAEVHGVCVEQGAICSKARVLVALRWVSREDPSIAHPIPAGSEATAGIDLVPIDRLRILETTDATSPSRRWDPMLRRTPMIWYCESRDSVRESVIRSDAA